MLISSVISLRVGSVNRLIIINYVGCLLRMAAEADCIMVNKNNLIAKKVTLPPKTATKRTDMR